MQRKRSILPLALALFLAGCVSVRKPQTQAPRDLSVTFLDVGQGDAALIRTPENETVLIDTGRNGETAALLRRYGVRRIDLLVLTHAHADHTGGVAAILKSFPVREVWYSGLDYKPRFRQKLRRAGEVTTVSAGSGRRFTNLALTVLHPQAKPLRGSANDRSLVLKATYGSAAYLFPGDCELGCWEELFKFHRSELRAGVLKAAHHGSGNGTNSGVLVNVRPKTFIISCGRGNDYGHPHPIVLKLIDKLGAQLLRSDVDGTIRCIGTQCAAAK
jgi:competence protein ComEC